MLLDEMLWSSLFSLLLSLVARWTYRAKLSAWLGQEYDVACDITSSSIRKVYEYVLRTEREETPIISLQSFAIVVARNLFHDTRRKDSRLVRGETAIHALEESWERDSERNVEETVVNRLQEEDLFRQVAERVKRLPLKERQATLTDMAVRIQKQGDFGGQPTPLRQAFIDVGIFLEDYLPPVAETSVMRSRRASLASLGYKHIAQSVRV